MSDTYNPNDVPQIPQEIPPTPPPPKKDNTVMLILSYIWILFLVPLIAEKDDAQVQWHAKHGMILTIVEAVIFFAIWVIRLLLPDVLYCVTCLVPMLIWVGFLVIRILCIMKATKGEKFKIPVLTDYVDKLKL